MKKQLFEGVATALVTPFDKNGALDVEGLKVLIDRQIENGISAIVVAGTTGEASTLSFEEYCVLISKSKEFISNRVPLIVGSGSNDTKKSLTLSLEAKRRGADGLLIITPYYNKTTQNGLIEHFFYIADNADLPIILYNVPSRTGMKIDSDTCKTLAEHQRIIAIKEAGGDISAAMDIALKAPTLALYSGNDDQFLPFLSIGGSGLISVASNLIPQEMTNIYKLYTHGMSSDAAQESLRLLPLIRALFKETNPIPIKKAMQILNLPAGNPRLPLVTGTEGTKELLKSVIKETVR